MVNILAIVTIIISLSAIIIYVLIVSGVILKIKPGKMIYKDLYFVGPNRFKFKKTSTEWNPSNPTSLDSPPGLPDIIYLSSKGGELTRINMKTKKDKEILNMEKEIKDFATEGEGGLMCVIFHPEDKSVAYLSYTTKSSTPDRRMDLVVSLYKISNINSEKESWKRGDTLVRIPCTTDVHHGGTLIFGDPNELFLSVGDGGPQQDTERNGQNPNNLRGKILRFDLNQDKPKPKIVAMGLRQPWKIFIDCAGRLWIGDVGQGTYETVKLMNNRNPVKPYNFGWPVWEGTFNQAYGPPYEDFNHPVFEYPTDSKTGRAIIGGYWDKENSVYVFGDVLGFLRAIIYNPTKKHWQQVAYDEENDFSIYSFGTNFNTGKHYLLSPKMIYEISVEKK
jgi:hypothetical protein